MTSLFICQMLFFATTVIFTTLKSQAKEEMFIKAKALAV